MAKKECEPCIFFAFRRVDRLMGQIYDPFLAKVGLKATQFTLLRALDTLGEATLPMLSEALTIDRTTLTRNLQLMEKRGWVAIRAGLDRRTRFITLTAGGETKLAEALPYWQQAQDGIYELYGRENWLALRENLNQMVAQIAALPATMQERMQRPDDAARPDENP
ncbi:MarR family transcriptional regulator [Acanthopleuribacter pedis]|uniref:Winged helix-turn-helix transcriptional regulator n=1 Tax=Acanthopleuribacter pedis TaxID=442870 RepID=A0A8J7U7R2_9BACT|nr:winged helix-turn-helix transcriptional regulator [Acanthopleuribacter pedis]